MVEGRWAWPAALALAAVAEARNRAFRSRLRHDRFGPTIVLSPHYDDAVLNCWSVLAAPESDVTVVNVFGGVPRSREPGDWDRVCEVADARELVVTRMKEDRGALARTGSRAINLPFAERQYRRVSIRPTFSRIDAELCSECPAVGRVLAPLGVGHPDHKAVQRYALHLLERGIPVTLYGEVPHSVPWGWPHWVTGATRTPHLDPEQAWEPALSRVKGTLPLPRVVRLDAGQAAEKLDAVREYGTQFAAIDGGSLGVVSNPLIHGFEVFWDLEPDQKAAREASPSA